MKIFITFFLVLVSLTSHCQWKVSSATFSNFGLSGTYQNYDSVQMQYNDITQGTITSLSPSFNWNYDYAPIWGFETPNLYYNTSNQYSGQNPSIAILNATGNQTFSGNGRLTASFVNDAIGNPLYKTTHSYNSSGTISQTKVFVHDGSNFVLALQATFSYDSQFNLIRKVTDNYGSNSQIFTEIDSFYYANNNLVTKRMIYNNNYGTMLPSYKVETILQGNKYDKATIYQFEVSDQNFYPFMQYKYTYSGNKVSKIDQAIYDDDAEDFEYISHVDYTFSNGDLVKGEQFIYNNYMNKQEYEYFAPWHLSKVSRYEYDENIPSNIIRFHYVAGILNTLEKKKIDIKMFPNPCENILQIESGIPLTNCQIYNQNGQLVLQQNIDLSHLNVSELENGNYTIRLNSCYESLVRNFTKK